MLFKAIWTSPFAPVHYGGPVGTRGLNPTMFQAVESHDEKPSTCRPGPALPDKILLHREGSASFMPSLCLSCTKLTTKLAQFVT